MKEYLRIVLLVMLLVFSQTGCRQKKSGVQPLPDSGNLMISNPWSVVSKTKLSELYPDIFVCLTVQKMSLGA